ncbi:MAG: hypothetical protein IIA45_11660 [Bacteroidetes bacterium]|nr:hypothetical protein [Bacteroidota bacterium]
MNFFTDILSDPYFVWPLIISGILTIAFVIFYPLIKVGKLSVKEMLFNRQRNFWAFVVLILQLFMVFTITYSHKTMTRIDIVSDVFTVLKDEDLEESFRRIYVEYNKQLPYSTDMRDWLYTSLRLWINDMEEGIYRLDRDNMSMELAKKYQTVEECIIVTNVGSTNFFFGPNSDTYKQANIDIFKKLGFPVIRFYLWNPEKQILASDSKPGDMPRTYTAEEFKVEVEKIHDELKTVYSVIIDYTQIKDVQGILDILVKDYSFYARSELTPQLDQKSGYATANPKYLRYA